MNNSHSCNNGKYLNKPETTMIERIDDNGRGYEIPDNQLESGGTGNADC